MVLTFWQQWQAFCKNTDTPNLVSEDTFANPFFMGAYRTAVFLLHLPIVWLKGIRISGKHHLPKDRFVTPYVIACTHQSNWDPPALSVTLWPMQIAYLAKQELYMKAWIRWLLSRFCTIAVNRSKVELSTVKSVKRVFSHKPSTHDCWHLGIFPEGTRKKQHASEETTTPTTEDTSTHAIKQGAAFFALKNKAPVLPVVLQYTPATRPQYQAIICPPIPHEASDTAESLALKIQAAWHKAEESFSHPL
ncbi:MAG: lysophospholipid acyltransferase family protein [Vampirovibrionales bacterium]